MGELDEKLGAILGNEQAMQQIMSLARSLGGEQPQPEEELAVADRPPSTPEPELFAALGQVDPQLLQMGMRAVEEYRKGDDKKTALLQALRPFVREERYEKLDRAIQAARLSRVLRVLFEGMRGDEPPHV